MDTAKNVFNTRIKDKILSCPNISKSFWSLAKNINSNIDKSSSSFLNFNNEIVSISTGKAELFAKQFHPYPANLPTPLIRKKGSKTLPSNYKPIYLLSIISKVIEVVLTIQLLKHLEQQKKTSRPIL